MYCIYLNKYNNKCKHNNIFSNNIKYCMNHTILLYNKYVITIQKIYIGYRVRKKIKNIFIKLPRDLQINIIEKTHINIIKNNDQITYYKNIFYNLISNFNVKFFNYNKLIENYSENFYINMINIYKKIIIYINYFDKSFLKYTYIISNNLLFQLNNYKNNKNINYLINIINIYCNKYTNQELTNIFLI